MTVTEVLTEITSRCGEGFANFTERAKAAFNASVRDIIANPGTRQEAITGLIYTGKYTFPSTASSLAVVELLSEAGYTTGTVRYMEYTSPEDGDGYEAVPLEQVSANQAKAISLNSRLGTAVGSVLFYKYESTSPDAPAPCITLIGDAEFEDAGELLFTIIGWDDTFLNTGGNDMSVMFSPLSLEMLIMMSADRLRKEILA